jgi:hypothetical protein
LHAELTPHDANETDKPAPVIELALQGHLGFKANLLELPQLRAQIEETFRPLLTILKNQTVPVEYAVAAGLSEHVSRAERERRVIEDLISRDSRFSQQAPAFAHLILETKRLALSGEAPNRIAELLEQRMTDYAQQEAVENAD